MGWPSLFSVYLILPTICLVSRCAGNNKVLPLITLHRQVDAEYDFGELVHHGSLHNMFKHYGSYQKLKLRPFDEYNHEFQDKILPMFYSFIHYLSKVKDLKITRKILSDMSENQVKGLLFGFHGINPICTRYQNVFQTPKRNTNNIRALFLQMLIKLNYRIDIRFNCHSNPYQTPGTIIETIETLFENSDLTNKIILRSLTKSQAQQLINFVYDNPTQDTKIEAALNTTKVKDHYFYVTRSKKTAVLPRSVDLKGPNVKCLCTESLGEHGWTTLHFAVQEPNLQRRVALMKDIRCKGSFSMLDHEGDTPFYTLLKSNDHIIKMDPSVIDVQYSTLLYTLKLFLNNKLTNIYLINKQHKDAMMLALDTQLYGAMMFVFQKYYEVKQNGILSYVKYVIRQKNTKGLIFLLLTGTQSHDWLQVLSHFEELKKRKEMEELEKMEKPGEKKYTPLISKADVQFSTGLWGFLSKELKFCAKRKEKILPIEEHISFDDDKLSKDRIFSILLEQLKNNSVNGTIGKDSSEEAKQAVNENTKKLLQHVSIIKTVVEDSSKANIDNNVESMIQDNKHVSNVLNIVSIILSFEISGRNKDSGYNSTKTSMEREGEFGHFITSMEQKIDRVNEINTSQPISNESKNRLYDNSDIVSHECQTDPKEELNSTVIEIFEKMENQDIDSLILFVLISNTLANAYSKNSLSASTMKRISDYSVEQKKRTLAVAFSAQTKSMNQVLEDIEKALFEANAEKLSSLLCSSELSVIENLLMSGINPHELKCNDGTYYLESQASHMNDEWRELFLKYGASFNYYSPKSILDTLIMRFEYDLLRRHFINGSNRNFGTGSEALLRRVLVRRNFDFSLKMIRMLKREFNYNINFAGDSITAIEDIMLNYNRKQGWALLSELNDIHPDLCSQILSDKPIVPLSKSLTLEEVYFVHQLSSFNFKDSHDKIILGKETLAKFNNALARAQPSGNDQKNYFLKLMKDKRQKNNGDNPTWGYIKKMKGQ